MHRTPGSRGRGAGGAFEKGVSNNWTNGAPLAHHTLGMPSRGATHCSLIGGQTTTGFVPASLRIKQSTIRTAVPAVITWN